MNTSDTITAPSQPASAGERVSTRHKLYCWHTFDTDEVSQAAAIYINYKAYGGTAPYNVIYRAQTLCHIYLDPKIKEKKTMVRSRLSGLGLQAFEQEALIKAAAVWYSDDTRWVRAEAERLHCDHDDNWRRNSPTWKRWRGMFRRSGIQKI